MESPFEKTKTFAFYLEPVLNTFDKNYMHIITLNVMPPGPIADMVFSMHLEKVSDFKDGFPRSCQYVLMRYPRRGSLRNPDEFMGADDIPSLIGYLHGRGYSVDTNISKLMMKGGLLGGASQGIGGNRRLICMASYVV
jgi:hypothetical protein|tara:strand:- start:37 stop:450 length:414 start_codon:yes stop_codon:yes gene_type:complete